MVDIIVGWMVDGDVMVLFVEGMFNDGNGVLFFWFVLLGVVIWVVVNGDGSLVWV